MRDLLLEMTGITKRFPGVRALDDVDFTLRAGEVHCLVGENGAGKSTLMKILAGGLHADSGDIRLGNETVHFRSPYHAQELGISMIYQEFNLCPYLSVAENIFLGRQPRIGRSPFIDWATLRRNAQELLARIGVDIDVTKGAGECSVAEQQMVEIAKALTFDARIMIMDEPSATLTKREIDALFVLIGELRHRGIGIIYISHRLEEIYRIGDRVTVMRDGKRVATEDVSAVGRDEIIRMMVGRELKDEYPKESFQQGEARLQVEGLSRGGAFYDVNLTLHTGEIVGLTGLVGSGRTEVARALFGADPFDRGEIRLDGHPVTLRSPRDAIRQGIGLLTEDRKNQGLVLGMKVRENMTLANLKALTGRWLIHRDDERRTAEGMVRDLEIRTPSVEQITGNLSGGNQQKVVLAKWLFTECSVLIFDEPTRGIDIGAKVGIYNLMNNLVRKGVCILMISSELPEVLGMCDRILVMHEGRIAGELSRAEATQEAIMRLATGEQSVVSTG
ncbi:MAG: sugar ABC transporter ATP-binding protein [Candidatus Hydrogenedentes bacterium]|nr:sugar ABC transporter ATP-binding protein [Candidatus Hydrogenedentota bacterium]